METFYEPPGFGVRQPSAAFPARGQSAGGPAHSKTLARRRPLHSVHGPKACAKRIEALPELLMIGTGGSRVALCAAERGADEPAARPSESGSIRALACADRRLAGRNEGPIQSPNGDSFGGALVVGEGAGHRTRGRVRSPSQLNRHGLGDRSSADHREMF